MPCIGAGLRELWEVKPAAALGPFLGLAAKDHATDLLLLKMTAAGAAPTAAPTGTRSMSGNMSRYILLERMSLTVCSVVPTSTAKSAGLLMG